MKQSFPLSPNTRRPLILLDDIFKGCSALIDTGALIPVWTKEPEMLVALGARLEKQGVTFSGFGGNAEGDLYRIDLKLGEIVFPEMPIIASVFEDIPGYFLFTATMFSEMDYTISNRKKEFQLETFGNQVCYNLVIDTKKGVYVLASEQKA